MFRLIRNFIRSEQGFLGGLVSGIVGAGKAILGSKIGSTVAGGLTSGVLGRFNKRKEYQQNRDLGFTHSEIAGSAAMGSDGGQAVMGNQYAQMAAQEKAREYDQTQRALDRQVAIRSQDTGLAAAQTSANATLGAASMSRDASYNSAGTQFDIAAMNNDRQWQELANKWAVDNPALNLELKQMTMGVENTKVTLMLRRNGLTPSAVDNMSASEFSRRMSNFMSEMAASEGARPVLQEGARQGVATVNDGLFGQPPVLGGTKTPAMPSLPR